MLRVQARILTADVPEDQGDRGDREAGGHGGGEDRQSASGNRGGGRSAGHDQAEQERGEALDRDRPPELETSRLDRHRRLPVGELRVVLLQRGDPRQQGHDVGVQLARQSLAGHLPSCLDCSHETERTLAFLTASPGSTYSILDSLELVTVFEYGSADTRRRNSLHFSTGRWNVSRESERVGASGSEWERVGTSRSSHDEGRQRTDVAGMATRSRVTG